MELGLWVNSIALNFWVESMLVNVGTTGVPGMNPTCVHLRGELNPKTKCQPPRSLSPQLPSLPPPRAVAPGRRTAGGGGTAQSGPCTGHSCGRSPPGHRFTSGPSRRGRGSSPKHPRPRHNSEGWGCVSRLGSRFPQPRWWV